MIKIHNIGKRAKKYEILKNVSLKIEGIYGLVGPNGAGKTTLMKILSSLISMNSGKVEIDGQDYTKGKYVKQTKLIGYLPQDFMVYPNVTVGEVLDHLAVLQGIMDKQERVSIIEKVLKEVNLQGHEYKLMIELSGGMRKRVGIAQLLMGNPSILIFDEPTAGLDIEERIRFRNLLRNLGSDRIIIISSHIVEDIEFLCTKIGVLKNGKVLFEGTPTDLKLKANGCIWECCVLPEEINSIVKGNDVIQISETETNLIVRIFSTEDMTEAIQVAPRLVDGYLAVVKDVF